MVSYQKHRRQLAQPFVFVFLVFYSPSGSTNTWVKGAGNITINSTKFLTKNDVYVIFLAHARKKKKEARSIQNFRASED